MKRQLKLTTREENGKKEVILNKEHKIYHKSEYTSWNIVSDKTRVAQSQQSDIVQETFTKHWSLGFTVSI